MSDFKAAKKEILRDIGLAIINTEGIILKTHGNVQEELNWSLALLNNAYTSIEGALNDAEKTTLDG